MLDKVMNCGKIRYTACDHLRLELHDATTNLLYLVLKIICDTFNKI